MYTSSLSYTVRKKLTKISTRLATCGIYYAFWIFILPHFGKYRIRQEVLLLSDETSKAHRLVKVPLDELEAWDREHDVLGQRIADIHVRGSGAQSDEDGNQTPEKKDV
jgi:hypothetical protein